MMGLNFTIMIAEPADFTGFDRQRYGDIRDIIEKNTWLVDDVGLYYHIIENYK